MSWILNDPPPKFGDELAECQMYQRVIGGNGNHDPLGLYVAYGGGSATIFVSLSSPLRGRPTIAVSGELRVLQVLPKTASRSFAGTSMSVIDIRDDLLMLSAVIPDIPGGSMGWVDCNNINVRVVIDNNL